MSKYALLKLAESVAGEYGDLGWFCEHYTRYREVHGIHISIERAIESVGLWDQYEAAARSAGLWEEYNG